MKPFFTLLFSVILFSLSAQVYVDIDATGANDGSSWADAYTDLDSALALTTPQEIWVAEGRYLPGPKDSTVQFEPAAPHQIYGGFEGVEASRDERDPAEHTVLLDGDLLNDDSTIDFLTERSDNADHVLFIARGIDDILIDGVSIDGGAAENVDAPLHARGGAIYSESRMQIRNCVFTLNTGIQGGTIFIAEGHGSIIEDCEFMLNHSRQFGAVLLFDVLEPVVRSCTFNNNVVTRGCLDIVFCLDAEVDSCSFDNNSPARENRFGTVGVIVDNSPGSAITNSDFSNNSGSIAPALYLDGSLSAGLPLADITSCVFEGNESSFAAGAVYARSAAFTLTSTEFVGNSSDTLIGALLIENSQFEIDSCRFFENESPVRAGALLVGANSSGSIQNSLFENNICPNLAGAMSLEDGSQIAVDRCSFLGNEGGLGGALLVRGAGVDINLTKSLFQDNTGLVGGGVYVGHAGDVDISEVEFVDNFSTDGGAIQYSGRLDSASTLDINRSIFRRNIAGDLGSGGAVLLTSGVMTISSSLIVDNDAINDSGSGGAILQFPVLVTDSTTACDLMITHCTIAGNSAVEGAGIAQRVGESEGLMSLSVTNTIVSNPDGGDYLTDAPDAPAVSGGGNLFSDDSAVDFLTADRDQSSTDPVFIDALAGDYRLGAGSPAIDSGVESAAHDVDLEGSAIIGNVDKGCYESPLGVATRNLSEVTGFRLLQNPAVDVIRYELSNDYQGEIVVSLHSISGRMINSVHLEKGAEIERYQIAAPDQRGAYMLQVQQGNDRSTATVFVVD